MRVEREQLCLYAVTDRRWLNGKTLQEQVELAILGGATFIQFREKKLRGQALWEQGREVREVCRKHRVPFVVNDDVELALSLDADGVHLGQGDMAPRKAREILGPEKIIGVSAHSAEEAVQAWRAEADYLGAGAVFSTGTKRDAGNLPHRRLQEICRAVPIPVVAIGGITGENVLRLAGAGIAGVAVVSAVFGQRDIRRGTEALKKKVEEIRV